MALTDLFLWMLLIKEDLNTCPLWLWVETNYYSLNYLERVYFFDRIIKKNIIYYREDKVRLKPKLDFSRCDIYPAQSIWRQQKWRVAFLFTT